MNLGHIERGMKMSIFVDAQAHTANEKYEAVFRYLEGDKLFVVLCTGLYNNFDRLKLGADLRISFSSDPNTYTFTGRALEKQRTSGLVLIEQVTDIDTLCSRQYDRDELRLNVMVYGLPDSKLEESLFDKPYNYPDLADVTYDISVGGVCVISNALLASKHDPYYLIEFSLSDRDRFLLPAKLVRRSNSPRTKFGRYDYGFQFIFDKMPDEKKRLSRSILNRKLSIRNSRAGNPFKN